MRSIFKGFTYVDQLLFGVKSFVAIRFFEIETIIWWDTINLLSVNRPADSRLSM